MVWPTEGPPHPFFLEPSMPTRIYLKDLMLMIQRDPSWFYRRITPLERKALNCLEDSKGLHMNREPAIALVERVLAALSPRSLTRGYGCSPKGEARLRQHTPGLPPAWRL